MPGFLKVPSSLEASPPENSMPFSGKDPESQGTLGAKTARVHRAFDMLAADIMARATANSA